MGYFTKDDCKIEDFAKLCEQTLDPSAVPQADRIEKNIPIYDMARLGSALSDTAQRRKLMAEWADVLGKTAGVLVIKNSFADLTVLDEATRLYEEIIAEEKAASGGGADHFAAAGANDRVWNALQKLCLKDPAAFARYHANPSIDAVAEAWLGRGYQMTSQVNLVRPGGKAQQAHRDFHLGFMTEEQAAALPIMVHLLSPAMTLQGAVAHCDMSVESGPTRLLPFSQTYEPGYLAYRMPEFVAYFDEHFVQLPLEKGDLVFFSPALFHAAGDNRTSDVARFANLLQVSSPMGRAMEAIDRDAMARALYPALATLDQSKAEQDAAIAACAEGYSFPTNLDTDPPIGGLAPKTQAVMMSEMLAEGASPEEFNSALDAYTARRKA